MGMQLVMQVFGHNPKNLTLLKSDLTMAPDEKIDGSPKLF